MNKTELIEAIAAKTGASKVAVGEIIGALEETVTASVKKGEKVVITGFISFDRVERKARTARNPQTGEPIQVKASRAPKVTIGAAFKKAIKG
ncbi:MAG: HU family DNA-binding protein [Actinomycetota bacterium]